MLKFYTFAEAYRHITEKLLYHPTHVSAPRGLKIYEDLNVCFEILNTQASLINNPIRSTPRRYLADELLLYFSGSRNGEDFKNASSFWGQILNPDGTVNSAYGNLIFNEKDAEWDGKPCTQWQWAIESLKKDKDSRQAIMHYNRPYHQKSNYKDFVCTVSNQFFIRNNKLSMTTYIRSNDLVRGLTFDEPFFTMLMQCMVLELKETYPGLELGTYTHFAGSMHIYERHFKMLKDMLDHESDFEYLPTPRENPIHHPALLDIKSGKRYNGSCPFLVWLEVNTKAGASFR